MLHAQRLWYPRGHELAPHSHTDGQLLFAVAGVMEVRTAAGSWVVPPQRAVWLPPDAPHAVTVRSEVDMRTLWLAPSRAAALPARPTVMAVRPLLREVIVELVHRGRVPADDAGGGGHLLAVLLDEMVAAPDLPLHLPMPQDPRARRVAEALRREPADPRGLDAWARSAGASRRTLIRLFRAETGVSFAAWRQQARLLAGLALLAEGRTVTEAALDSGYANASAFTAMFRRTLGVPPSRFFARD